MRFRCELLALIFFTTGEASAQAPSTKPVPPPAAKASAETPSTDKVTAPIESLSPDSSAIVRRQVLPNDRLQVDDPMLKPVPAAKNVLKDWRDALKHVKARAPNLLRAHAAIEASRGQSRIVLSRSLPTLTGTGTLQHQLLFDDSNLGGFANPATTWNIGATLRVPILSARNWYDYATSRNQIKQAKLQAEDAERLIIGALAEAIVMVVTTERLAEVTRVNLAAALSTLELNKRRARLGAGSALDVLRAKQEVARSRAQVVDSDESLRQAREGLGRAMGYAEPWSVTPTLKLDQLRADARNTCKDAGTLESRADLRAARAGAAVAERNLKSFKYSFLPTIDAVSTYTYFSEELFISNNQRSTWTLGAQLTWRLYDGGLRYGERQLNQAQLVQSQQDEIDANLSARVELSQATRGVKVALQSLAVAEESRKVAEDNATLAKAKFINGTGTSFDMVDTQRTARQTTIDVTVKEFELLRAEIIAFLALATCEI